MQAAASPVFLIIFPSLHSETQHEYVNCGLAGTVPFVILVLTFSDPSNAGGDSMYAMMKSVPGGNMSAVSSLKL